MGGGASGRRCEWEKRTLLKLEPRPDTIILEVSIGPTFRMGLASEAGEGVLKWALGLGWDRGPVGVRKLRAHPPQVCACVCTCTCA